MSKKSKDRRREEFRWSNYEKKNKKSIFEYNAFNNIWMDLKKV